MIGLKETKNQLNQLEPQSFVDAFIENPPEDFEIETIQAVNQNIYGFSVNFDLLTTIDESLVGFVDKLRKNPLLNFLNKKILTPKVTFTGTTVSEYSLFPEFTEVEVVKNAFLNHISENNNKFFIVKDIPLNSPLLSERENNFSYELINCLEKSGFQILSGQAMAYLPINFSSFEEYLKMFSSKRRSDLKRKMKFMKTISMKEYSTGDDYFTDEVIAQLYRLYLNVYNNSYVNFDKLTFSFFRQVLQNTDDGKVFIYSNGDKILSFNLCYILNNRLVDKYRGYLYPDAHHYKLFFNQFFDNIKYCLNNNLDTYILGCSFPKAKEYLGCRFTYTNHAVYIRNPVLRHILKKIKHLFEFDKNVLNLE